MPFVSCKNGGQRGVIASRSRTRNRVALSKMIEKLQKRFSIPPMDAARPPLVSDESLGERLVEICD